MAKTVNDDVLDGAWDILALGTELNVCSAEPTTRTEAITTFSLADVVLTAGDGNGDWTIANGDTSGRKCTCSQQASITVDTTGTATHIAITDATRLLYVTECTSQALTAGNTVTVPAWDAEIADPT